MKNFLTRAGFLFCGLTTVHGQIQVHELMASNARSYADVTDFEDYPDWIELKNTGAAAVGLGGYFLSDDPGEPFKWAVPATASIPAGGYLLFMADGHDAGPGQVFPRGYWPWKNFTTEKYHTNFGLGSTGESVLLTHATGQTTQPLVNAALPVPVAPQTVAVWKYLDNGSDQSTQWRARTFNDSSWASGPGSLGYGAGQTTTVGFGPTPSNKYYTTYFRHAFTVANPAALHGLTLKTVIDDGAVVYLNGSEIARINLPAGEIGYRTPAVLANAGPPLAGSVPIPVSALVAGENVIAVEVHQGVVGSADILLDLGLEGFSFSAATIVDSVAFGTQVADVSYGRDAANPAMWRQFAEPTPGAGNTTAVVNDVRVDGTPVTASLAGGLYATNQTVALSSPSGQIRYTLNGAEPHSTSALYTGPLSITATTVVRARCFEAGKVPGPILTRTYFRGETQGSVPYISVVADPETLFGSRIGIYANQHESVTGGFGLNDVYKGKDAPGNVEFFPVGGGSGFRANCGIRIGGENNWVHPQKALNLAMRSSYGDTEVKYDLFPGTQIALHSAFTLRDGGDNWDRDMLRDALYPKLAHGQLNVDTADYRPSVVFINGAYYGIHDIRQRWDNTWFSQQFHLPSDKVDHLLYGHITSTAVTLGVDKGDPAEWLALMSFINTSDLTVPANWNYVESRIDIESFMDFVISESFGNNTSWLHNREFWKAKQPGARWRWFLTDMDRTFSTSSMTGILSSMLASEDVLRRLKLNGPFRGRLAQRYAAHAASTFKPSRVDAILSAMDTEVAAEVPRHAARWAPNGTTVAVRNSNIQNIKDYTVLREANFSAEVSNQLGVGAAVNLTLAVDSPGQGQVLVQGVPVDPSTFRMFPNVPFTLQAMPAPGFAFSSWTGATGGSSTSLTIAGAATVTAHFVPFAETVIGGTLAAHTTLSLTNSPYVLGSDLIVPAGITLTIPAGVRIAMPALRNIRVQGVLDVNGTAAQPVLISGRNGARWGGISFENPTGPSHLTHVTIRQATKGFDTTKYPSAISGLNAQLTLDFIDISDSEGPVFCRGGNTILRDSTLYNPYTGDCINIKQGLATTQRCVFPGNNAPDTDAIDYDGVVNGLIEDCRIHRFQGSNSDGIDVGEACVNVLIQRNLIYYNSDKGISVGQGSTVILRKNLVVGCVLGVGIKDTGSFATIDQNTFASCNTGVAIYEKNFGDGGGSALITNTIISKSSTPPVTVDGFSTVTTSHCLSDNLVIDGPTNLLANPQFIDPVRLNYQVLPTSPAVNSGDPAHALDPDSTIVDRGAQYFFDPTHYPYTLGETVVINEVLANSGAASDWIELHNRTRTAMNVGGWFLSDSGADFQKYRIPAGTVIPPGGYVTFYESTNFGLASVDVNKVTGFALSDIGETLYLSSAVADQLTDYQSKEDFGPSTEGETLGAYYKPSSDSYNFVALTAPTPSAANEGPRIGPIVISEIMYRPLGAGDAEYAELLNVSAAPVILYDSLKGKPWRLSDGIDFEFPVSPPLTMAPGERIILTKNIPLFTSVFGGAVPAGTRVFEWLAGGLSNGGETLQLDRPGAVDALNVQQYVRQDRVGYEDSFPWPVSPDGTGPSLTKISEKDYGNDFINWMAAAASPGSAAPGSRFAGWAAAHGVGGPLVDSDGDGYSNLLEYAMGTNPMLSTSSLPFSYALVGGEFTTSFEVDPLVPDVDYFLEASANLVSWTRLDAPPVTMTAGKQTRTFKEPAAAWTHRFYRLGVKQKP
jgi:CotH kinase protein/Lamin Tail Domain/Chitobiase/beta-hexosaminidase C-terminal domain/Right handed beta helix region/Divergent InlB B-repeat domain